MFGGFLQVVDFLRIASLGAPEETLRVDFVQKVVLEPLGYLTRMRKENLWPQRRKRQNVYAVGASVGISRFAGHDREGKRRIVLE